MAKKENCDFIQCTDCIVHIDADSGGVLISNISESFLLTPLEWEKVSNFVKRSKAVPDIPDSVQKQIDAAVATERERICIEIKQMRLDAWRYQLLRLGRYWSVINGIGDTLRADALDAAIDFSMKYGVEIGGKAVPLD